MTRLISIVLTFAILIGIALFLTFAGDVRKSNFQMGRFAYQDGDEENAPRWQQPLKEQIDTCNRLDLSRGGAA
jgi:hypothetical protein